MKKRTPRTPAALRERGVWGERGFSQRSRLSPQSFPSPRLFGREREGGGFSTEKPPPSQSLHRHRLCQISWLVYVAAAADGHVVGKELNGNNGEKRRKLVGHGWEQP